MSSATDCVAPKPRNRLRKLLKRRPESIISNVSPRGSTESSGRDSAEAHGKLTPRSPSERASLVAPPDLSDPRWQEYVRESRSLRLMEKSPHLEHTRSSGPSSPLLPEFAHLTVSRGTAQPARSVEDLPPPPSPHSTLSSSSSTRRRYAKTPVLRIGQLEGEPSPIRLDHKASDADSIAGQYRALLDPQSCESLKADLTLEEAMDEGNPASTRQLHLDTIRCAVSRRGPLPPPPPPLPPYAQARHLTHSTADLDSEGCSPTSDETLVDFEEDAIYFKPAFSPEALTPIPEDEDDAASPASSPPQPGSLSMQITMELLAEELAGTLRRNRPQRAQRGAAEMPPLQTLLMIEAYGKLRDQVQDMQLPLSEVHALQDMFDMWLGALHRVHDDLADERETLKGVRAPSEHRVEWLQTVDLD
ncbi:unnamed protein product [Discula destructiva]